MSYWEGILTGRRCWERHQLSRSCVARGAIDTCCYEKLCSQKKKDRIFAWRGMESSSVIHFGDSGGARFRFVRLDRCDSHDTVKVFVVELVVVQVRSEQIGSGSSKNCLFVTIPFGTTGVPQLRCDHTAGIATWPTLMSELHRTKHRQSAVGERYQRLYSKVYRCAKSRVSSLVGLHAALFKPISHPTLPVRFLTRFLFSILVLNQPEWAQLILFHDSCSNRRTHYRLAVVASMDACLSRCRFC